MRRFGQGELSVALLALAVGAAQACTADRKSRDGNPQPISRLVLDQADGGFVIRAAPSVAETAAPPPGPIFLGGSVRFDRRLLLPSVPLPSNPKDLHHGETR